MENGVLAEYAPALWYALLPERILQKCLVASNLESLKRAQGRYLGGISILLLQQKERLFIAGRYARLGCLNGFAGQLELSSFRLYLVDGSKHAGADERSYL